METENKKINFPLFIKLLALSGILIAVIVIIALLSSFSYDKLSDKEKFTQMIIKYNEISKELTMMEHRRRDNLHLTYQSDTARIMTFLKSIDSLANQTNIA